ncbi:TBRG4 isoform 5, partial [Pan troglodytes]
MAAHLVKRCTCLLREAARQAPAMAPVGRLRLAWVAHKTLTSSATSPISHLPGSLMEPVEKERASTPYVEKQVDHLIKKATRPEELLELLGGSHDLDSNQAAMIASVWHGTLSKLLGSLYALGIPKASKELQSVEQEVRWRMRKLKYKHLAFLAESCATLSQEQHSQELLAELLMHLERRWTEIEDSHTLVTVMMKVGHLSEPLMNRLEDKCLELVEHFGPNELRKVLVMLAAQSRRSVPLLRAISYHLVQKPFSLTKDVLLDVAYAYGKLSFHQTQVSQRLAT